MKKNITLDFEANFDKFKSEMNKTFEEVAKLNEKFLGKDTTKTSSQSDSERIRHERTRLEQSKTASEAEQTKFYSKYTHEEKQKFRSKTDNSQNPFEKERRDEFNKTEAKFSSRDDKFQKLEESLNAATDSVKKNNVDETLRHREYKGLSDKQLKQTAEDLKVKQKEALENGDVNKAEGVNKELQSVQAAQKWRDNISNKEQRNDGGGEQMKFMRQTARNMFLNDMMGQGTQILGHGTGMINQVGQTGFQGYSAASASGMGIGGSLLTGGALAAVAGLVKLFSSGEDLLKAENKVSGVRGGLSANDFSGKDMSEVGIGGPADVEMMLEKSKNLARTSGYGGDLVNRTKQQYLMQRSMGLEEGDTKAFEQFERSDKNMNSAEGVAMLTSMLGNMGVAGVQSGGMFGDKGEKDLSRLPKYLEKLLIINEKTFQVTGELNKNAAKNNMAMLGGATSLGGIFKDERNASNFISGVQNSFANPGDDLMKFQNIRAIRESSIGNSNLSPSEIIKMSENMNDPNVVNQRFKNLKQSYGGAIPDTGSQRYASMVSDFQTQNGMDSFTKAEQAMKAMNENGGLASPEMMDKFMSKGKDPNTIMAEEASKLTTNVEKLGSELGNVISDLATAVRSLAEKISKFDFFGSDDDKTKSNTVKMGGGAFRGTGSDGGW